MTKDQIYEEEKAKIDDCSPEEYERKIKEICKKLDY